MRIILVLINLILCGSFGTAQYYWNNTYNNIGFYSELSSNISILGDGSFLVPTVSTNANGFHYNWRFFADDGNEISQFNLIDSTSYLYPGRCNSFFQSSDGNFLQSYIMAQPGVMKFDNDGELLWQISIDTVTGAANAMIELSNGDIFFLGAYISGPHINFMRIDDSGIIEQQVYATPIDTAESLYLEQSKELEHQNILLGGFSHFYRPNVAIDIDGVMMRIDSLGNILWTKIWDDDTTDQLAFFCDGDDDSTVVMPIKKVTWYEDNDYHDPFTALVGTALVNVNTGDTSNVIFTDMPICNPLVFEILRTPDNGYCMMGWASDDIHTFTFLMKLDANRQLECYKTYAPEPPEVDPNFTLYSWDIEVTADSGFVVCGEASDWGNNGPNKQMPWVFKTDQCGELEWNNCGADNIQEFNDSKIQRFKIAPNPASSIVQISSDIEFVSITIRDITGKILFSSAMNNHLLQTQLDVSLLSTGLYLIEVNFGKGIIVAQRLVVD